MRKDTKVKSLLFLVDKKIEMVRIFLKEEDSSLKDLKFQISLLSSLLEVRKKLRFELKELDSDIEKPKASLSELL